MARLSLARASTVTLMLLSTLAFGPSPATAGVRGNPFTHARLFVEAETAAQRQAEAWRQTRPGAAVALARIAAQPQAIWFGSWIPDPAAAVAARLREIRHQRALPLLVIYRVPGRGCTAVSAAAGASYRRWIADFTAGLGDTRAAVVLEPDGLAELDCLTMRERRTRVALIRHAVKALAKTKATVYLDAGHSHWHTVDEMARRLRSAGISDIRGFSLNVANYNWVSEELDYGERLSRAVGGRHFVVDTSRSGNGPSQGRETCNASGRALGPTPTTDTSRALADAFLWIKRPGESDGRCNGGPSGGQWWPDYAVGLSQ